MDVDTPPDLAPVAMLARHRATPSSAVLLAGVDRTPRDVETALRGLERVAELGAARDDPRAVFPDVYGVITRRVRDEVVRGAAGAFLEPAWISRLAGLFCERYYDALACSLEGRPVPSAAWRLAFDYGARGLTIPAQDALLGISAHINFDLAQGLADNITAHGNADDPAAMARYRHDHDAVNAILRASIVECLDVVASRYRCRTTAVMTRFGPARGGMNEALLAMFAAWRARVWDDTLALLHARGPAAHAAVVARMDRRSGALARVFCAASTAVDLGREVRVYIQRPARASAG